MKTLLFFRLGLLLSVFLLASLAPAQTAPAQTAPASAPALPGYWNIETNGTTRDYTIVRFYDGHDQLLYEERLPTLCLDFTRRRALGRRTSQQLELTLQAVLANPAAGGQAVARLSQQLGQSRRVQNAYATR